MMEMMITFFFLIHLSVHASPLLHTYEKFRFLDRQHSCVYYGWIGWLPFAIPHCICGLVYSIYKKFLYFFSHIPHLSIYAFPTREYVCKCVYRIYENSDGCGCGRYGYGSHCLHFVFSSFYSVWFNISFNKPAIPSYMSFYLYVKMRMFLFY